MNDLETRISFVNWRCWKCSWRPSVPFRVRSEINVARPSVTRRSGMLMRAMSFMGVCVKEFQFAALRRRLADAGLPPAVIKDRVLCAADNDFSIRKRARPCSLIDGAWMERGWGAGVMNVYGLCKNGSFNFITRAAALKLMVQRAL